MTMPPGAMAPPPKITRAQDWANSLDSVPKLTLLGPDMDESYCETLRSDSGYYSSTLASHRPSLCPAENFDPSLHDVGGQEWGDASEYVATELSESTEVPADMARKTITEFCNHMYYRHIRGQVDGSNKETFFAALPWAIKSFAIQLGMENTLEVSRKMMLFTYKRHREIVNHLRSIISGDCEDDETSVIKKSRRGNMSIQEKMLMWLKEREDICPDASEYFEGVPDDQESGLDVRNNATEESTYIKVLLESEAYDWLTGTLRRESQFQWDDKGPRAMLDVIRDPIMKGLPTGVISTQRQPTSHRVRFLLPWSLLANRFQSHEISIFDAIVLVSSSLFEMQAITVEQYFRQTWDSDGIELLLVLQDALFMTNTGFWECPKPNTSQREFPLYATIQDKEPSKKEKELSVFVTGPACVIVERAEQLAWLAAALRPGPAWDSFTLCHTTPSLTLLSPHTGTTWGIDYFQDSYPGDSLLSLIYSWTHQNLRPVIVRGYPTVRRPEVCPGVEIATQLLFSFFRPQRLQVEDGHVTLIGDGGTLELLKRVEGVYVWHFLQFGHFDQLKPRQLQLHFCSCWRHISPERPVQSVLPLDLDDLKDARHIVGDCQNTQAWVEQQRFDHQPDSVWGNPQGPESNAPESPPMTMHTPQTGEEDEDTLMQNTELTDSSLDSDMLSIADTLDSKWPPVAEQYQGLSYALTIIADQLYREYQNGGFSSHDMVGVRNRGPDQNNNDPCTPSSAPSTSGINPQQGYTRGSIRKRKQCNDMGGREDEDDEEGSEPPTKRGKPTKSDGTHKWLACPFWKLNPGRYKSCFKNELMSVSRLKQHLTRKHTPQFYCDRCNVIFDTESAHENHKMQPCVIDPYVTPPRLEGITYRQTQQLQRRSNPSLSVSDQWFAIWDILFPGVQRPASVYLGDRVSEAISQVTRYTLQRGPELLARELEASGILLQSEQTEEERGVVMQELIRRTLANMFEDFQHEEIASHPRPRPTYSRGDSYSTSSFLDSGIGGPGTPTSTLVAQPLHRSLELLRSLQQQRFPLLSHSALSFQPPRHNLDILSFQHQYTQDSRSRHASSLATPPPPSQPPSRNLDTIINHEPGQESSEQMTSGQIATGLFGFDAQLPSDFNLNHHAGMDIGADFLSQDTTADLFATFPPIPQADIDQSMREAGIGTFDFNFEIDHMLEMETPTATTA